MEIIAAGNSHTNDGSGSWQRIVMKTCSNWKDQHKEHKYICSLDPRFVHLIYTHQKTSVEDNTFRDNYNRPWNYWIGVDLALINQMDCELTISFWIRNLHLFLQVENNFWIQEEIFIGIWISPLTNSLKINSAKLYLFTNLSIVVYIKGNSKIKFC